MEALLWRALRDRQLGGLKFRRQVPLGPYIVDFACLDLGLVVEADGRQHEPEIDAPRTRWLEERGYKVLRFANEEILENLDGVLRTIAAAAQVDEGWA